MNWKEINYRVSFCKKCLSYRSCSESQKAADPSAECPLPIPVWGKYEKQDFLPSSVHGTSRVIFDGPALWKELHLAAVAKIITPEWLSRWEQKIPAFSCKCRRDYYEIKKAIPFRADDQFSWSVDVHNAVNKNLDHPIISLEEALTIWGEKV